MISGFPKEHSVELIKELCDCFGKVQHVKMLDEPGSAQVEFQDEFEAKQAMSSMMGLQVGRDYLHVKKCLPPTEEELI